MKKLLMCLAAVMAVAALAGSAWAQAVEPGPSAVLGGRIWTDIGYQSLSKEQTVNRRDDVTTALVQVSGHSYLNGRWTSADKTTGGLVEINVVAKAGDTEVVGLRYAYGWWKVGNCQLIAGQTDGWLGSLAYGPLNFFGVSQSQKTGLTNWGFIYSSRSPQVRFEWRSGNFGFSVAAVQPAAEGITTIANTDMYANLPRFDVAAEFKAGGFMTTPAFGWSQLKYQGTASGWADDGYTTWLAMLPFKYTVGPFTAKVQLHTGINTENEYAGELPNAIGTAPKIVPIFSAAGKLYDTKEVGGSIALEYRVGALMITAGYGQQRIENDFWKTSNGFRNDSYDRRAWFLAAPYEVTKNFTVGPEIGYYMYGDSPQTGQDMGTELLAGLQFKFLF
jgi:hypothetical protein